MTIRLIVAPLMLVFSAPIGVMSAGAQTQRASHLPVQWSHAHDSVAAAALRFFFVWGEAWRVSEATRHPVRMLLTSQKSRDTAYFRVFQSICYLRGAYFGFAAQSRGIPEGETGWGICPSWFAGGFPMPPDERDGVDRALIERVVESVRTARAGLIALIDSAVLRDSSDPWLVGQLVRFMVDQREFADASERIRRCGAARWWCAALEAYTRAAQADFAAAARSADAALAAMPDEVRCDWTDNAVLLDAGAVRDYASLPCGAARDSANRVIWWLSDPLLSVAGNERRTEQFVRHVSLALRTSMDRDERLEWRADEGGGARAELIMRYGWPSYIYWHGYGNDTFLADRAVYHGLPLVHPVNDVAPTYEYARSRVHLVPDSTAFDVPYAAASPAWTLSDPARLRGRAEFGLRPPSVAIPGRPWPPSEAATLDSMNWWPREHAAMPVALDQIPDGQVALLRRDRGVLIATSNEVPYADSSTGATAVLVVSPSPDSVEILDRRTVAGRASVALNGVTRAPRAIVGVEMVDSARASRTRFGVISPVTLTAMKRGEVAVSDPVVLTPESAELSQAISPDSVLRFMAPSLTLSRSWQSMGVYWEIYGFQPSDTVDVAVWIERKTPQSFARRLGIAFSVVEDLNTPVVVSWREPVAGHGSHVVPGPVPVMSRRLSLSVASLAAGEYTLEIAVARPGEEPVRGRRTFMKK